MTEALKACSQSLLAAQSILQPQGENRPGVAFQLAYWRDLSDAVVQRNRVAFVHIPFHQIAGFLQGVGRIVAILILAWSDDSPRLGTHALEANQLEQQVHHYKYTTYADFLLNNFPTYWVA